LGEEVMRENCGNCGCQGNRNTSRLCFQSNLIKVLEYASNLLREHNIPFWLMAGTLLGAVRNGKMIPWDNDVDIGIWHHDAKRILDLESRISQDGFELGLVHAGSQYWNVHIFSSPGCLFHIDMFTWEMKGEISHSVEHKHYLCPTTDLQNLDEIEFEGTKYPCPQHVETTLSNYYGPDWRTPKVHSSCAKDIRRFHRTSKGALAEIAKYGYYD